MSGRISDKARRRRIYISESIVAGPTPTLAARAVEAAPDDAAGCLDGSGGGWVNHRRNPADGKSGKRIPAR